MANIWNNPSVIAAEALTHLEDALVIGNLCAKDVTSDFTTRSNGYKVGDSVSYKTNGEFEVTEFTSTITAQPIRSSVRALTIEKHFDISVEVTSKEATLNMESFSEQVLRPSIYKLAEKVDTYLGTKILTGAGLYVSDSLFASAADIALARKKATLQQLNPNRYCLVDLDIEATLLGQTWFNQAQTRGADGEATLRNGVMGQTMGMEFFSSIAFPTNTTAFTPGTAICAVNNGSGGNTNNRIGMTTLTVDTQTASKVLVVGDRLAIAGVRRPLKVKTAIADTSATTEIELVDPITEIIPDNAAVTVIGTGHDLTWHGAVMDSESIGVAFPLLDLPGDKIAASASNNGITIRIVKGYDMTYKKDTLSMDLLCGAFVIDPRRVTVLAEY